MQAITKVLTLCSTETFIENNMLQNCDKGQYNVWYTKDIVAKGHPIQPLLAVSDVTTNHLAIMVEYELSHNLDNIRCHKY